MIFKDYFKRYLTCGAFIFVASAVTISAQNAADSDFEKDLRDAVASEGLKIVGYDSVLDEPIYEASEAYYQNIYYEWAEDRNIYDPEVGREGATIIRSRLSDRATNKFQIIALLREVYSNPRVPGFRRDAAYDLADFSGDNGNYFYRNDGSLGYYISATDQTNGYKEEDLKPANRADFVNVSYAPVDYYPYFISADQVQAPLNGATALVVELTDDFYFIDDKSGNYKLADAIDSYKTAGSQRNLIDKIFNYIKAVSIMPKQLYVDYDETNGNPGFIFNIDAKLSKCFFLSKGCNRAFKSFGRQGVGEGFYAGEPFFHMFEEYSPKNTGPELNAYEKMSSGIAFEVDHNCGTSIQQQHDIVFGDTDVPVAAGEEPSVYNVNLMLFIPDFRFNGITCIRPDQQSLPPTEIYKYTYTPYSFYGEHNRPYIYFNKINAQITTAFFPLDGDGERDSEGNFIPYFAHVPLEWTSQYNKIVGHDAPEAFTVYRVVHGNPEPDPLPYSDFIILSDKCPSTTTDEQWNAQKGIDRPADGVTIHSLDETVYIYVREAFNAERAGNEVSYVIRGHRDGTDEFIDVQSNVVFTHLPGNSMTLELIDARSEAKIHEKKNHYKNYINLVYNGYEKDGATLVNPNVADGNLLVSDLVSIPASLATAQTPDVNLIKPIDGVELHVYRIKVLEEPVRVLIGKFKFNPDEPIRVADWNKAGENNPASKAIVAQLDWYRCTDSFGNPIEDKLEQSIAYTAKRNFGEIVEDLKDNTGEIDGVNLVWQPLDNNDNWFIKFDDEFDSAIDSYATLADRFRYYVALVNINNPSLDVVLPDRPVPAAEEDFTVEKLSNYANVFVPKRQIFAGFVPYPVEVINADTDQSLEPNHVGLAVHVLNNENVSHYIIYDENTRKFARIDRYSGGSFEPSLYGDDEVTLYQQSHRKTEGLYSGRVIIDLPEGFDETRHFTAIIHYYDSGSLYAGNTYIMPTVEFPERPVPNIDNVTLKYKSNTNYDYDCTISLSATLPDGFKVHEYGVWYSETEDGIFDLKTHPSWNSAVSSYRVQEVDTETIRNYTYEISHSQKAGKTEPVSFYKSVRLYAELPAEANISVDSDDYANPVPGYIVADTKQLVSAIDSSTTGVEDVAIDGDAPVEYFNLQGVRVAPENISTGVYLRRRGNATDKIIVK